MNRFLPRYLVWFGLGHIFALLTTSASMPRQPIFLQEHDDLDREARALDSMFAQLLPGESLVLTSAPLSKEGNEKLANLGVSLMQRVSAFRCVHFVPAEELLLRPGLMTTLNPSKIVGGVIAWDEAVMVKVRGLSLSALVMAWSDRYLQADSNFEAEGEVAKVEIGLQIIGPHGIMLPRKAVTCTATLVRDKNSSRYALLVFGSGGSFLQTVVLTPGKQQAANLAIAKCLFYLVGKMGSLPYWKVETNGERDSDVIDSISADFGQMPAQDKARRVQELLCANGLKVETTGVWDRMTDTFAKVWAVGHGIEPANGPSASLFVALMESAPIRWQPPENLQTVLIELRGPRAASLYTALPSLWCDLRAGVKELRPLEQAPHTFRVRMQGSPALLQAALATVTEANRHGIKFSWTESKDEKTTVQKLVVVF